MVYDDAYNLYLKVVSERELSYPLDVLSLIKSYGLLALTYEEASSSFDLQPTLTSNTGFLCYCPRIDKYIIFYNQNMSLGTIRFTLLHELYHYLIGDLEDTVENDRLANCFARNLLAPASLCKALGISKNIDEIREFFITSVSAAKTRYDFFETDMYHIKNNATNLSLRASST